MVSTRPPISKSPSPFSNPLVTNAPITIGIIVTCMFLLLSLSLLNTTYKFDFGFGFFVSWLINFRGLFDFKVKSVEEE